MKNLITILFLLPFVSIAQKDSIVSGAYNWQQPPVQKNKISSVVLTEGRAHDFEWMQLNANSFNGAKEIKLSVASNQEELIIVKSGSIDMHLGDSSFILTPNSIAVLTPGQQYTLKNSSGGRCDFYSMK